MAKAKLSKDAINFLIQCRDDTSIVYTWEEIADLLKENFCIEITRQAVAQNYRKYKGKIELHSIRLNAINNSTTISDDGENSEKIVKAIFERKENVKKSLTKDKDFDMSFVEDLSSEDLDKLLKGE